MTPFRIGARDFSKLARRLVAGMAIAVAVAFGAAPARGGDDLDREMGVVAAQIKLLLTQKGMDSITVGEFRGPTPATAGAGPAMTKALADSLRKLEITVKPRCEFEVHGEYRDVEDRRTRALAVQIKACVVDRTGSEVVAFEPRGVMSLPRVASLLGVTAAVAANATPEARNQALIEAVDHPKVHLTGTRIAATATSPYAIEILVKSVGSNEARPRSASRDDDGSAFLRIQRGESYEVKLINDSPLDAAVTLTIDGLNSFAFSETPTYSHWVVAAKSTLTIPGWHQTNTRADSFLVAEYAASAAAAELPNSSTVGMIAAGFAAAWPKNQPPPSDEAPARKGSASPDATKIGPPVGTNFAEVVRNVGQLRASISVHYTKDGDPKDLPGAGL